MLDPFRQLTTHIDIGGRKTRTKLDEGKRFPLCHPNRPLSLFQQAGLREGTVEAIDIVTDFETFDEFWRPFLGGVGPAPSYVASLEAQQRDQLKSAVRRLLPRHDDSGIDLVTRAWAVRGQR